MFLTRVSGTRRYRLAPEPGEPAITLKAARRILAKTDIASIIYNDTEANGVVTFDFVIASELVPQQALRRIVAVFLEGHLLVKMR